jgi:hypothetical protein
MRIHIVWRNRTPVLFPCFEFHSPPIAVHDALRVVLFVPSGGYELSLRSAEKQSTEYGTRTSSPECEVSQPTAGAATL